MRRDRRSELRTGGCCRRRAELEALREKGAAQALRVPVLRGQSSSGECQGCSCLQRGLCCRHPEMLQPGQSPLTAQKQPKEQLECLGMSARWVCRGAQTAIPGATSWSSHTPTWGPGDARGVSPALSSPRPLLPSLPAAAKEGGHSES
ncbi:uncharacterized protein LOC134550822 isoform X3 [Prinia subflava]|uniref:uncharacterized protein LOC134550822 isoform X3 n=1 Tax=Prinia subflava TaxID=208062 RepID=UPI002FDFA3F0